MVVLRARDGGLQGSRSQRLLQQFGKFRAVDELLDERPHRNSTLYLSCPEQKFLFRGSALEQCGIQEEGGEPRSSADSKLGAVQKVGS